MQSIVGEILSGEFDDADNMFTLQTIKSFQTETTLKKNQLESLYGYLIKHQDEDGQIISLFDQMLIRLSQEEVKTLLADLESISRMYH
ncbi:hypothetical protein [Mesobacillus maritimus]|uniref:hypothetical protein n=1 Tax=Mesobacillus maritimus TaxID=1643336 RepID=UPI00384CCE43